MGFEAIDTEAAAFLPRSIPLSLGEGATQSTSATSASQMRVHVEGLAGDLGGADGGEEDWTFGNSG